MLRFSTSLFSRLQSDRTSIFCYEILLEMGWCLHTICYELTLGAGDLLHSYQGSMQCHPPRCLGLVQTLWICLVDCFIEIYGVDMALYLGGPRNWGKLHNWFGYNTEHGMLVIVYVFASLFHCHCRPFFSHIALHTYHTFILVSHLHDLTCALWDISFWL